MSVGVVNQVVEENDEVIVIQPLGNSVVVVVASEGNTQITITPTQDVIVS